MGDKVLDWMTAHVWPWFIVWLGLLMIACVVGIPIILIGQSIGFIDTVDKTVNCYQETRDGETTYRHLITCPRR